MSDWLYDKIERVPTITPAQVAEMRHINPVLKVEDSPMFRRIAGAESVDPFNSSFLWDAKPEGGEFTFHTLNVTTIITQHHSSVFFKPSLAEVYAWLRVYMPNDAWRVVRHFCMGECFRIGATSDFACKCEVMGGDKLFQGRKIKLPGGIGYELGGAR